MHRFINAFLAVAVVTAFGAAPPRAAAATIYTFDTAADLDAAFERDVILGDSSTIWRGGYGADNGFPASDGGFVHFNQFNTGNSLRFRTGPVTLLQMDVSSQWSAGGAGVNAANVAAADYRLMLYDAAGSLLYDEVLMVATRGAWGQVMLGVADVAVIRIPKRSSDGTGTSGWWPNIDNIVVAGAIAPVPGPATLPLLAGALALLAAAVPLRRRATATCQSKTHRGM